MRSRAKRAPTEYRDSSDLKDTFHRGASHSYSPTSIHSGRCVVPCWLVEWAMVGSWIQCSNECNLSHWITAGISLHYRTCTSALSWSRRRNGAFSPVLRLLSSLLLLLYYYYHYYHYYHFVHFHQSFVPLLYFSLCGKHWDQSSVFARGILFVTFQLA